MTSSQRLSFAIRAVNEASATLRQVQDDVEGVGTSAHKSGGMLSGFGGTLGKVGAIAGGFIVAQGIISLPGFLTSAATAAADDAASLARLQQAVNNTGVSYESLGGVLDDTIVRAQKLGFSDDQARGSLSLLTAQTDSAEEANRRFALAMDLARGANIDVEVASRLLGKVTEDNVNVLARYGISVQKGASETELFGAVQAKFGGQAEVFANSTAGQMERTKIQLSELKEQIGAALLPAISALVTFLVDTALPAVSQFGTQFVGWFRDTLIPAVRQFMAVVREQWALFKPYYDENIAPIVQQIMDAIGAVIQFVVEHWPEIWAVIGPQLQMIGDLVVSTFKIIGSTIDFWIKLLNGDFAGAWRAVGRIIAEVFGGAVEVAKNAVNQIIGMINGVLGAINTVARAISSIPGLGSVGQVPTITPFADGGIVTRPTLALLGEAGPEMVTPLSRAGNFGFAGSSPTINIYVAVPVGADNVSISNSIVGVINEAIRNGGVRLSSEAVG